MTTRRRLGADFIHIPCHKRAQRQPRRSCIPNSQVHSQVSYQLDETGNLTSDGLKDLDHDACARLGQVRIVKDGEAAKVVYHHNGLGQRVFKSEPQAEQTLPSQAELGVSFRGCKPTTDVHHQPTYLEGHGSRSLGNPQEHSKAPNSQADAMCVGMCQMVQMVGLEEQKMPIGKPKRPILHGLVTI